VHLSSLSYNELASVAIDQERMMKAVAEADEKNRKRMMPGSAGSGSSSGAPPKYRMVYPPPSGSAASTTTTAELGPSPTIPTAAIQAATITAAATAAVQPCPYTTAAAGYHQATTTVSRQQLSMLQLREDEPLCSRMLSAQAKQLVVSSGTHGQSAEGPSEGSYTTGGSRQLHHRGGDSHGRRSASGYVLPQRTPCYYSVQFWSIT
jgi:hypothetical protein